MSVNQEMACHPLSLLNQSWISVNWTLEKKLSGIWMKYNDLHWRKINFENAVCKMAVSLFRCQCFWIVKVRTECPPYTCSWSQSELQRLDGCNVARHLAVIARALDCYTVLFCWQLDCLWGMRHGPRLVGITLSLVGLKIDGNCPVPNCIIGSRDLWEFPLFADPSDNPFALP